MVWKADFSENTSGVTVALSSPGFAASLFESIVEAGGLTRVTVAKMRALPADGAIEGGSLDALSQGRLFGTYDGWATYRDGSSPAQPGLVESVIVADRDSLSISQINDGRTLIAFDRTYTSAAIASGAFLKTPGEAVGTNVADAVRGGAVGEAVFGRGGDDSLWGFGGDDRLYGGDGANLLDGGDGADALYGGSGGERLSGGVGDDALFGEAGDDRLSGGLGADRIYASAGFDVASGGGGDDTLYGEAGADTLAGGDGADSIMAGAGADRLSGGEGRDRLFGDSGKDTLLGEGGDDEIFGTFGDDALFGGAGVDALYGDADADTLTGGAGVDYLRGGSGADVFRFTAIADSGVRTDDRDVITDFTRSEGDRIDLRLLDADVTARGNQAFTFIAAAAFHELAGELRYRVVGSDTFLYVDLDGDGAADMSVKLAALTGATGPDFLL